MKKEIEVDITQIDLLNNILTNDNTKKYNMCEIVEHILDMMTNHDNMPTSTVLDWLEMLQDQQSNFYRLLQNRENETH